MRFGSRRVFCNRVFFIPPVWWSIGRLAGRLRVTCYLPRVLDALSSTAVRSPLGSYEHNLQMMVESSWHRQKIKKKNHDTSGPHLIRRKDHDSCRVLLPTCSLPGSQLTISFLHVIYVGVPCVACSRQTSRTPIAHRILRVVEGTLISPSRLPPASAHVRPDGPRKTYARRRFRVLCIINSTTKTVLEALADIS